MRKKTALIIEDQTIVALEQKLLLESKGFLVVSTVRNSIDAFKCVEKFKPSLILCDVQLQGELDGLSIVSKIREQYFCEIIFVSAYLTDVVMKKINELLPCYCITKPYMREEIEDTLDLIFSPGKARKVLIEKG